MLLARAALLRFPTQLFAPVALMLAPMVTLHATGKDPCRQRPPSARCTLLRYTCCGAEGMLGPGEKLVTRVVTPAHSCSRHEGTCPAQDTSYTVLPCHAASKPMCVERWCNLCGMRRCACAPQGPRSVHWPVLPPRALEGPVPNKAQRMATGSDGGVTRQGLQRRGP